MPMLPLYKQLLVEALATLQHIKLFKDEMFIYKDTYFWITDNGGEVNVEKVNDARLPLSIPDGRYSSLTTPAALSSAVRDACEILLDHEMAMIETRDSNVWQHKLLEWVRWISKYNMFWDYKTIGV